MVRRLSATVIASRKKALETVLAPHYKSVAERKRAAKGFVAMKLTAPTVEARIERMKIAGVPLTGLQWKIGGCQSKFDALIFRYEKLHGLTKAQATLVSKLGNKGVSSEVIQSLVKTRIGRGARHNWTKIKAKIDYLESIRLDPKIYGISRLQVADYEGVLDIPLCIIKNGIQKQVLWAIEDRHMGKKLDEILPGWRTSKSLKTKLLRPGIIFRKYQAAIKMRLKPTFYLLSNYSVKVILAGKARTNSKKPRKGGRAGKQKTATARRKIRTRTVAKPLVKKPEPKPLVEKKPVSKPVRSKENIEKNRTTARKWLRANQYRILDVRTQQRIDLLLEKNTELPEQQFQQTIMPAISDIVATKEKPVGRKTKTA